MNDCTELLGKLKLTGIKESIDFRMEEAAQGDLNYKDFLSLILEDECLYRLNKKSETLCRKARFNELVCLEEFECSPSRGITKSVIKQLHSLHFMEKKENIVFVGGTGAGKTYLAQAIGHRACLNNFIVYHLPVNKMFKEIQESEVSGQYLKHLEKFKKANLVILDDFGLRNYSHQEANVLYDMLEDRYRQRSLIVTTQIKPPGWKTLFEDQVIAEAIVDRIQSCAHIIDVKGPSFRKNHCPKEKIENEKNLD
jgi:DNA replication protein DnaC